VSAQIQKDEISPLEFNLYWYFLHFLVLFIFADKVIYCIIDLNPLILFAFLTLKNADRNRKTTQIILNKKLKIN